MAWSSGGQSSHVDSRALLQGGNTEMGSWEETGHQFRTCCILDARERGGMLEILDPMQEAASSNI